MPLVLVNLLTGRAVFAGRADHQCFACRDFPGFESIAGFEFAEALYNQAIKMGAEIVYDKVTGLQDYGSHKGVQTEYGGELLAKAVILATGARVRPLGLENEDRFIGSGVSYCATCDGAFFKDKKRGRRRRR